MAVVETKTSEIITCLDIELAVAREFNPRMNLIVPNVFWGLGFSHELDVAVMTPARYLTEIEIKTSASDLKRDHLKPHQHQSQKIRRHFFAVPQKLKSLCVEVAPLDWGIFAYAGHYLEQVRHAKINKSARPLSEKEAQKLYELAAMRIWTLKQTLNDRIQRTKLTDSGE